MVTFRYDDNFVKALRKIRDPVLKEKVKRQVAKLFENPELGKPMRFARKGTREVYVSPFRLSYLYSKEDGIVTLRELYHKDEQ